MGQLSPERTIAFSLERLALSEPVTDRGVDPVPIISVRCGSGSWRRQSFLVWKHELQPDRWIAGHRTVCLVVSRHVRAGRHQLPGMKKWTPCCACRLGLYIYKTACVRQAEPCTAGCSRGYLWVCVLRSGEMTPTPDGPVHPRRVCPSEVGVISPEA